METQRNQALNLIQTWSVKSKPGLALAPTFTQAARTRIWWTAMAMPSALFRTISYNTASTFCIFLGGSGVGVSAGLGFTNEWHLYHSEVDVRAIGPDPFDVPTIRQWLNSWPPVLERLESQSIKGMAWLTCSLLCSCRLIKFCLYMLAYLLEIYSIARYSDVWFLGRIAWLLIYYRPCICKLQIIHVVQQTEA